MGDSQKMDATFRELSGRVRPDLVIEQYRQAAEEYRAEDRNTWQTFAIVLALNAALVGLLDVSKVRAEPTSLFPTAIVGIVSVIAGVLIILRTRLYQSQRLHVAMDIQRLTGIELYFGESIESYLRRHVRGIPVRWYERLGGRQTMVALLLILGLSWLGVLGLGLYLVVQPHPGTEPGSRVMKRIQVADVGWRDSRGWGVEPLKAAGLPAGVLKNLHVVSMEPGTVRGNHYHQDAREWLLVLGGPAEVVWMSESGAPDRSAIGDDEAALFEIPPGTAHAVQNASDRIIYLLSFGDSAHRGTVKSRPPLIPEHEVSGSEGSNGD